MFSCLIVSNITSAYNINSFRLHFLIGSTTYNTYTIAIPDGFYTTTSLNFFLQQFCITNGFYLINGSGQNVCYFSIQYSSYQYGNQIITTLVPSSHPGGFTRHTNWVGYPSVATTPAIEILNDNLGTFLGSTTGFYPALNTNSNDSVDSPITPVRSYVNSVIIRCE